MMRFLYGTQKAVQRDYIAYLIGKGFQKYDHILQIKCVFLIKTIRNLLNSPRTWTYRVVDTDVLSPDGACLTNPRVPLRIIPV